MAYTVLLDVENATAKTKHAEAIMKGDKLVNEIEFLCPGTYGENDLSKFQLIMLYRLPVSHHIKIELLELAETDYKEQGYLRYVLPIDTALSSEAGDISIQLIFLNTSLMPDDGHNKQQSRSIAPFTIHVCDVEDWLVVPDEAMNTIAQLYIANKNMLESINALANQICLTKLDDIKLDKTESKIYGTVSGNKIGNGIDIAELATEIEEKKEM